MFYYTLGTKFLIVLFFLVFTLFNCKKQAKNEVSNPENSQKIEVLTPENIQQIEVAFDELSIGDLPHYIFKNVKTGEEIEFQFDENLDGINTAIEEINQSVDDEGKSCLKGERYNATLENKLTDIMDWNGEQFVKTGKKEKVWVLTKLEKTNPNYYNFKRR